MIKNIVINGCSFTQDKQDWIGQPDNVYQAWPNYVAEHINADFYKNLAMGGAGNNYICNSTIEYLHTADLDPKETLVLVMWSGISRIDLMLSAPWTDFFRKTYQFIPQHNYPVAVGQDDIVYYLLSGGQAGGWAEDKNVKPILHALYRVSDDTTLCKQSLLNFINLQNYLKINGYFFKFTTFINLWNKSVLDYKESEIRFGESKYSILQNFDFSSWFFLDAQRNSFGEYAHNIKQIAHDHHPLGPAHKSYAHEIVLPSIRELL